MARRAVGSTEADAPLHVRAACNAVAGVANPGRLGE